MNEEKLKILKVIKRLRDSFHESVATYSQGRCYQFAKALQEIFGGSLYNVNDHVVCKIEDTFYDIHGDSGAFHYNTDYSAARPLTEEDEWRWDANYHSGTVEEYMTKYRAV